MAIVIIVQSPVETKSKTFAIQSIVTVPLPPMRVLLAIWPPRGLGWCSQGPCPVGLACASISQADQGGRGHNQGRERARRGGRAAGKPAKWQRAERATSASDSASDTPDVLSPCCVNARRTQNPSAWMSPKIRKCCFLKQHV